MRKRHKGRKQLWSQVLQAWGLELASVQAVNQQECSFQKATDSGGAPGAGQGRLLQQLHKQTNNSGNVRAVGIHVYKTTCTTNPSWWSESQRYPQTAFFQRIVFCLKCPPLMGFQVADLADAAWLCGLWSTLQTEKSSTVHDFFMMPDSEGKWCFQILL